MARKTDDPAHVIVPIGKDVQDDAPFQERIRDPGTESGGIEITRRASPSNSPLELTQRRHNDLSSLNKSLKGEEINESGSHASATQWDSRKFVKRMNSRLQDPHWGYDRLGKEDNWFLDEDVLGDRLKKKGILTIFQFASLLLLIMIITATLSVSSLKSYKLYDLPLWKWEFFLAIIISGHLVSGWGVRIAVFFIERAFLSKIRVLYFIYGMRRAVQYCIWLALITFGWHYLVAEQMTEKTNSAVLKITSKCLLCLLVASFVWLLKVVFVKVLASSFYDRKFFERIQMYLLKQYVIKNLCGGQRVQEGSAIEDVANKRGISRVPQPFRVFFKDQRSLNDQKRRQGKTKESGPKLKSLISFVHSGFRSTLSILDVDLPDSSNGDDEDSFNSYAQRKAKRVFENVAQGSEFITLDDLKQYVKEDKAILASHLFEGIAENGCVSEQSFINWMVDALRERRHLLLSLNDTKTAVEELHHLMDVIVVIIIVIVWLIIFDLSITHFLVLLSTQLLLIVFIFGNTCKTVFEAIIFLFVMHPFDVGDRCEVDEVQMVVEEMNILTTAFERYDGQKIIYPNSVLSTKPIGNYNRSPHMGDQVEFSIHISTPPTKIEEMKERIKRYIESNDKHWYRDPTIVVKDIEDMNRLIMAVWPRHKINHQDMLQRWVRRGMLIDEMVKIFRDMDIEYRMLPFDLNVRNVAGSMSHKLPSNWTTCYNA